MSKSEQGPAGEPEGQQVVTVDHETGEIVEQVGRASALELLHKEIARLADEGTDPETEVMDRIIGNILMAESIDDVLDLSAPLKAEDVLGEQLVVHGISFTESDFEDVRVPYYATLHAVRSDTGRRVVINCGGEQVLAQALWLSANATWPVVLSVVQVGKEKPGRSRPYRLTWSTQA